MIRGSDSWRPSRHDRLPWGDLAGVGSQSISGTVRFHDLMDFSGLTLDWDLPEVDPMAKGTGHPN
jgi:hypothetical protein